MHLAAIAAATRHQQLQRRKMPLSVFLSALGSLRDGQDTSLHL